MNPTGIGNYTWQDVSGNDLNGTVYGAKAFNLPANDEQIAIEAVTEDEKMSDAIPAGYQLMYILVENQTANADTLQFGTTEWGSQIAAGTEIPASENVVITVNKYYDSETDICVSDANGHGWHSNHVINAILRRIK